jgi:DNA invertase Pin-like site-specific DNA recombinase
MTTKAIAVYVRVSSRAQDTKSQLPELQRWVDANADGSAVEWHTDQASGRTMDRTGWNKLQARIRSGHISQLVVWRLDRLGRTASGLTALFDELNVCNVKFVSLKDGLDLSTAAGRLMAGVLASVAAYETEVRRERVLAGQKVARDNGKRWGGSEKGKRKKVTPVQESIIRERKAKGDSVSAIAEAVKLSRPTIYDVLKSPMNDRPIKIHR